MVKKVSSQNMNELVLLTDGSVNMLTKVGFGAYLLVTELEHSLEELSKQIRVKRFEQTSSTKLELQTLLWALNDTQPLGQKLTIYSDSQNIIRLPNRRAHLEQNDYRSKKNILLRNHQLYREFYHWSGACKINCVNGHSWLQPVTIGGTHDHSQRHARCLDEGLQES